MQGAYLGPDFSDKEIAQMSKKTKAVFEKYNDFENLTKNIAAKIADGNIVGWFQGRMEFGPRALGNRSILADARDLEIQKKLNLKIKFREEFRPFAPSVLREDASQYFDLDSDSPYMLLVAPIKENMRKALPQNYHELSFWDKLYCQKSEIQGVTHVDFSARIQTVSQDTNPEFWQLQMDYLVINNYVYAKNEQPHNPDKWKVEFKAD